MQLIDFPGMGDQNVTLKYALEQWNKSMIGKKINVVLCTHKATDSSLHSYNAAHYDLMKNSVVGNDSFVLCITFINLIPEDAR